MNANTTPLTMRAIALCGMGLAKSEAGVIHEVGGNNRGPEVQFKQHVSGGIPGESWCADQVFETLVKGYCVLSRLFTGKTDAENQAMILAQAVPFSRKFDVPRTGSTIEVAKAAKANGRFRDKHFTPVPGDLVEFDMPVDGQQLGHPHHIGYVIRLVSPGLLETVEGNTSSGHAGSQGDGDGVFIRQRATTYVYGYVHW